MNIKIIRMKLPLNQTPLYKKGGIDLNTLHKLHKGKYLSLKD